MRHGEKTLPPDPSIIQSGSPMQRPAGARDAGAERRPRPQQNHRLGAGDLKGSTKRKIVSVAHKGGVSLRTRQKPVAPRRPTPERGAKFHQIFAENSQNSLKNANEMKFHFFILSKF